MYSASPNPQGMLNNDNVRLCLNYKINLDAGNDLNGALILSW